jgi:hypothetical protein
MADQDTTTQQSDPQVGAIMKGFRTQFPDYNDMPDTDILGKMYLTHYSDLKPSEYLTKMTAKFAPDYKPPAPPTLGERVATVGKAVAALPGQFARGIAGGVTAPALAGQQALTGRALEKTAASMPEPDIAALRKKGYNEHQIRNVVQGYVATQQSLMGDIQQTGKEGVRTGAEGIAMYATLPFGGVAAGAGKAGLARSVGVNALFGAGYGAIDEGINRGADAAAKGASTSQILDEVTHAVAHGAGEGAKYGALGGAVLHGIGAGAGAVGRSVGDGMTVMRTKLDPQWAARIQAAEASALKNRQGALADFADKFNPSMVLTRFKPDYDAWQAQVAQGAPPEQLAASIASKLYGEDAMAANPTAVQMIADKLTPWLDTQDRLAGPMMDLAPTAPGAAMGLPAVGVLPNAPMTASLARAAMEPGGDLTPQGGIAPQPTPPALQGPLGRPGPGEFVPPTGGIVRPPEGFQGPGIPSATVPPLEITGNEPTVIPRPAGAAPAMGSPAATLRSPLGVEGLAPTPPEEIAPRLTQPPPGPAPVGPPAGRVEPIELPKEPSRLAAVRESGEEFPSLSLPTEPVEKVTRAIQQSGPAIEGLTTTTRKIEGATVDVVPSADGTHVTIKSLKGAEHGQGASGKALDKIISTADAAGAPIQVTVADYAGPRGGKIPATKIASWYEKRGFKSTGDETPGSITLVRTPRATDALPPEQIASLYESQTGKTEPGKQADLFKERIDGLPANKVHEALGNVTEGQPFIAGKKPGLLIEIGDKLDIAAENARARLNKKLGRLSTGVDPTSLSDLAIIGAAKMYRIGLTRFKPWAEEMVRDFGENIREHLQPIFAQVQSFLRARMEKASGTFSTANKLLAMSREGRLGADWYNKTKQWTEKAFGDDSDMFLRFLSATSAGMNTDVNVSLAMKAYAQWKLGLPFDEFLGTHRTMLERAVRGEQFGDRKIQSILQALRGDENAVVIDTRVMRTLGFKLAGKGQKVGDSIMGGQSNLTGPQYALFESVIRDLARQEGMTPREFQAALWTTNKIKAAQEAEQKAALPVLTGQKDIDREALREFGLRLTASKKELHYTGSFRPYEDITAGKLGGLTPLEWLERNRVTYEQISDASKGVTETRAGGGFTYDPYTFKPTEHTKGIVVTLASQKVPTKKLTGSDVIDFTRRFKRLTDVYYGTTVGTFNLEKYEPGMSSIDFNIILPESMLEQAKELGRTRKQLALWDLAKGEEIPTGYKGVSATIPKGGWQKMLDQVDDTMQRLDLPSRAMKDQPYTRQPDLFAPKGVITSSTLEAMARTPHRWGEYASQALGVSEDEVHKLVDEGKLTPMSDYNMTNKVEVHKDGTVWEYIDPQAPSYNIMKLVGSFSVPVQKPGAHLLGGAQLLDYLAGKDVLTGHDVVQNFRSQAGFLRPGAIPGATAVLKLIQKSQTNRIVTAMVKNQGEIITNPSVFRYTRPQGMSLWVSPEGQIVRIPFHLRNAARVIEQLKLKNPVEYEGPEQSDFQTILNHGFLRVQMHEQSYAVDATAPLTAQQTMVLKAFKPGPDGSREFMGRVVAPNGEHRNFYQGVTALNDFITASKQGSK